MDMVHERDTNSEEEVMAGELRRSPRTVEVGGSPAHQLRCYPWRGLRILRIHVCIIWW
jgi:hypothetical protein